MLNYRNTITALVALNLGNNPKPYQHLVQLAESVQHEYNPLSALADKIRDYVNALSLTQKGWQQDLFTDIREYEIFDEWHNIDYYELAETFYIDK